MPRPVARLAPPCLTLPCLVLAGLVLPGPGRHAIAADVPPFSERTADAGLTFIHMTDPVGIGERYLMTPGLAVGDFDRDGFLDLFVQGGSLQNSKLFMNDGDGTFTDRAADWCIDLSTVEGSSAAAVDIDGNGYIDLYAGTMDDRDHLFMNDGGECFAETGLASGAGLVDGVFFHCFGATFGDCDLDGDLDLATTGWGPSPTSGSRVFIGAGDGTFVESTIGSGAFSAPQIFWSFTASFIDLDDDRYPDLPVAADFVSSQYYADDGDGTFSYVSGNGTGTDENGMGSCLGDFDNDGDPDWFVTSIFDEDGVAEGNWGITGNRLYRNEGNHQYTDVTDLAGVRHGHWGWGAGFGDFNNDGLLDLIMTNGMAAPNGKFPFDPTFATDPSRLWINTGDFVTGPTFTEVAVEAGFVHTSPGKGLVTFDADNDGDLDVCVTANRHALQFFRNDSDPAPDTWLEIDLVSPPGNAPDGIGAKLEITVGGNTYHRWVHGSPSFMSQDPLRVHVGYPAAAAVDHILVRWPGGTSTHRYDVPSGQVFTLRPADLNDDGVVCFDDLLTVLATWGRCVGCVADITGDGVVGFQDLLTVLASWGPC